jgi:hypothetical protein
VADQETMPFVSRLSVLQAALDRSAGLAREARRLETFNPAGDPGAVRSFAAAALHGPAEGQLLLEELHEEVARASEIARELQRELERESDPAQLPVPFARRGAR